MGRGVALGVAVEGFPLTAPEIGTATQRCGFRPAFVNFYLQWDENALAGLAGTLEAIRAAGAIPVLTWEPMRIMFASRAGEFLASAVPGLSAKDIKDSGVKVQASIQDEKVRVTGKSKDDLQTVIQMLRGKDYPIPLQFTNYR